jgi:hypothetical protein
MSFRATTLKRSFLSGLLLALASVPVFSQAANSPVVFANTNAITTSFVQAPALGGSSSSSSGDTMWLKVELQYGVAPVTGNFLDAVEFKIWIEGVDMSVPDAETKGGLSVALTGSVTYVNIAANKSAYAVFYVHPSTLARYSKSGSSDFDRKFNIHVEANVGGAKMDFYDKKKEENSSWYSQLKAIPGLVYTQNQCPFMLSDSDRYPAIKLPENK